MFFLSPVPEEGLVEIPDTMAGDPAFDLVRNNPAEWKKLRCRHDFEYWCLTCCRIKHKITGRDVPFRLNNPQRRVAAMLEEDRLAGRPIRLIMLKARQWGGSTLVLAYMAWIQSVHCRNWNSVICSQCKDTSATIRRMYSKILDEYPLELWDGDSAPRLRSFEGSRNVQEIAGRGCTLAIASMENPNAARGSDIALAHLSEVAFWKKTARKSPEDVVRAICSSVGNMPLTMIVMESTANGVGNFFHSEWLRCRDGKGDKRAVFVPWYEIEMYRQYPDDPVEFEKSLDEYERMLRDRFGCDLQQICWYRAQSAKFASRRQMMAEFPTTDDEAFENTGRNVFGKEHVEALRRGCREPLAVGEVVVDSFICKDLHPVLRNANPHNILSRISREKRMTNYCFVEDSAGLLKVWEKPVDRGRYVVAVDIGGRSEGADYSVIAVLRADVEKPVVVAQWRGHIDHDILARKAHDIGCYYNEALLAVESNTLETIGAGMYIFDYLKNCYPRLYYRGSGKPGFHTNSATKGKIVTGLMAAVRTGAYIERCADACNEMAVFEQDLKGSFSAKEGFHDDILITRAIALSMINS